MEEPRQTSKTRVIATTIMLSIALIIALFWVPTGEAVTLQDMLRLTSPVLVSLLFFLFFPKIAQLSRHVTTLFIQYVAKEITNQISTFSSGIQRRSSKNIKTQRYVNPMILDTSAVIDGRLQYILATGFIFGTFIVPNFILLELQSVADSASAMKRQRGRRGLEVLEEMRNIAKQQGNFSLVVVSDNPKRIKATDEKLLKVAKRYKATIVTCDYNLNKVATVSGIKVLNVNELVNAVKTVTLPGETLEIKLIQRGKEREQGVGYLEDGTMVVVEDGQVYLGSEVKITVSRVIQTSAGRMIFGVIEDPESIPVPPAKTTN